MTEETVNNENPEEVTENVGEENAERTPFEEFLFHQRRAMEEAGKALEALLPEGFRNHSVEASKEFKQGFRILVDAAMEEIRKAKEENAGEEPPVSTTGENKVRIEVE